MFGARPRFWLSFSHHRHQFEFLRTPSFCTDAKSTTTSTNAATTTTTTNTNNTKHSNRNNLMAADERYRQLENLDMMTAAKMLFTGPPNKKKFGFDFHLVQFFFACLPSLAVYLVAQYARYDMRKMEAEVEQKKKERDEKEAKEKEKELELNPSKGKEPKSDPQLVDVKVRLAKLEEAVKEIVVESKKQSESNLAKNQVIDSGKKHTNSSTPSDKSSSSPSNKSVDEDHPSKNTTLRSRPEFDKKSKGSVQTPNSSPQDVKSQNQGGVVS